jgi:hypothetical protein
LWRMFVYLMFFCIFPQLLREGLRKNTILLSVSCCLVCILKLTDSTFTLNHISYTALRYQFGLGWVAGADQHPFTLSGLLWKKSTNHHTWSPSISPGLDFFSKWTYLLYVYIQSNWGITFRIRISLTLYLLKDSLLWGVHFDGSITVCDFLGITQFFVEGW